MTVEWHFKAQLPLSLLGLAVSEYHKRPAIRRKSSGFTGWHVQIKDLDGCK